jgi:hypothetical protein
MNWVFISQKTTFFIVTAARTSSLTEYYEVLFVKHRNHFSVLTDWKPNLWTQWGGGREFENGVQRIQRREKLHGEG